MWKFKLSRTEWQNRRRNIFSAGLCDYDVSLFLSVFIQFIDLMEGLIPNKEEHGVLSQAHLQKLVIFAVMWSVGALLELGDRIKMQHFMTESSSSCLPEIVEGNGDTIFEFVVDSAGMCSRKTVLLILPLIQTYSFSVQASSFLYVLRKYYLYFNTYSCKIHLGF